jgi:hypothetical protein
MRKLDIAEKAIGWGLPQRGVEAAEVCGDQREGDVAGKRALATGLAECSAPYPGAKGQFFSSKALARAPMSSLGKWGRWPLASVARAVPALLAVFMAGPLARAQPLPTDIEAEIAAYAQKHFERGYELAQQGDYIGAARELAEANRLKPNASVLFNLAQAYAASGQAIAAHDAFEEYLRASESAHGAKDEERHRLVRHQLEVTRAQIGRLELGGLPDGAELEIDGRSIGVAPLLEPVRLIAGHHAVVVRARGYQTHVVNVVIQPREESRVSLQLEPLPTASNGGFVVVACDVPDLEVSIDDRPFGKTPLEGPLAMASGEHSVSLRRSGYVPQFSTVEVRSGTTAKVSCLGRVDAQLTSAVGGLLAVAATQFSGARIYVDGRPSSGKPALVPAGKHHVRVTAPNYQPWMGDVEVEPGGKLSLSPALVAAEGYWRESVSRRDRQRSWSQLALGTGLTFLATAVTLSLINAEQRDDWARERDRLNGLALTDPGVPQQMYANHREALQIQRLSDLMVASAALAGGTLGLSAFLWLTTDALPASGAPEGKFTSGGTQFRYVHRF